jgi:hypothetical protein
VAPTTTVAEPDAVPIWPAFGEGTATPEEAAASFIAAAFDPGPELGAFQAGDQRSGEIDVFATEAPGQPVGPARMTLLLRQLAPDDAWYVIGVTSGSMSIEAPASGDTVPAGPITVDGAGVGFEATVIVEAISVATGAVIDQQVAMAGNFDGPEPFTVDLDLSTMAPGDVVVILARGGVGLETDPGDAAAIAVVIG